MSSRLGIQLFHILVIAPFFLYVAVVRGQISPWIFSLLTGLGIVLLVYHGYKSVLKWKAQSPSLWINLIHVLAVAPLMIFIGAKGYDTPRWAFELLAMMGFAAFGYHLYSIVVDVNDMTNVKKVKFADDVKADSAA
jgi:threonine/homoserine/homoserine lactone efflux protein